MPDGPLKRPELPDGDLRRRVVAYLRLHPTGLTVRAIAMGISDEWYDGAVYVDAYKVLALAEMLRKHGKVDRRHGLNHKGTRTKLYRLVYRLVP